MMTPAAASKEERCQETIHVVHTASSITLNAPFLFEREDFQAFLSHWPLRSRGQWYEEVVLLIDPSLSGDGNPGPARHAEGGMPDDIWDAIVACVRATFGALPSTQGHVVVMLRDDPETLEEVAFHEGDGA